MGWIYITGLELFAHYCFPYLLTLGRAMIYNTFFHKWFYETSDPKLHIWLNWGLYLQCNGLIDSKGLHSRYSSHTTLQHILLLFILSLTI